MVEYFLFYPEKKYKKRPTSDLIFKSALDFINWSCQQESIKPEKPAQEQKFLKTGQSGLYNQI